MVGFQTLPFPGFPPRSRREWPPSMTFQPNSKTFKLFLIMKQTHFSFKILVVLILKLPSLIQSSPLCPSERSRERGGAASAPSVPPVPPPPHPALSSLVLDGGGKTGTDSFPRQLSHQWAIPAELVCGVWMKTLALERSLVGP